MAGIAEMLKGDEEAVHLEFHLNEKDYFFFCPSTEKILNIFLVHGEKLEKIASEPLKKKATHLFSNGKEVFVVNKFGDVLSVELGSQKIAVAESRENKADGGEEDGLLKVVTNLFSEVKSVCAVQGQPVVVLSDDYYRIKTLSSENLQRIFCISSLRRRFVSHIFLASLRYFFIFDDGKYFSLPPYQVKEIENYYRDSELFDLVEFGVTGPSFGIEVDGWALCLCDFSDKKSDFWLFDARQKKLVFVKKGTFEDREAIISATHDSRTQLIKKQIQFEVPKL